MKMSNQHARRNMLRAMAALAILPSGMVAAKEGFCVNMGSGQYKAGVNAEIVATSDMKPGDKVRDEKASGDGHMQLACVEGTASFGAIYKKPLEENLVPLMVGDTKTGFGVELYVEEKKLGGARYAFPSEYQYTFDSATDVSSDDANMGYIVRRMSGPIAYGPAVPQEIGQQWAKDQAGRKIVHRQIWINQISIVRPSCSIVSDDLNQEVKMGDYGVTDFDNADLATPWMKFTLRVEQCQDPANLFAKVTFGMAQDADPTNPNIFSLTGVKNVGLELGDENHVTLVPGKEASFAALGNGKAYVFNARLRKTKATIEGGGGFNRPVKVLVEFR